MILIGKECLFHFIQEHADARNWIEAWIAEIEGNQWKSPDEFKRQYPSVSFLPNNILIFNVKGNLYRLEVQVAYKKGIIQTKWVGTHAEYNKRYRKGKI